MCTSLPCDLYYGSLQTTALVTPPASPIPHPPTPPLPTTTDVQTKSPESIALLVEAMSKYIDFSQLEDYVKLLTGKTGKTRKR